MKKIFTILVFALIMLGASSCQKDYLWGETKYYEDFLWCKYEPVEMAQTIEFELNSDGKKFFDSEKAYIKFKVVGKDGKSTPKFVDITFNGKRCDDYTFVVKPNGESVSGRLGVIFHNNAPKGKHELLIKYVCNSHISKVEVDGNEINVSNYTLEEGKNVLGFGLDADNPICVKKRDAVNPLLAGLIIALVVFVGLLVAWLVARRFIYPPIKGSVTFVGPGNFGGFFKSKGYVRMVFTNQVKKQGFFNRFFKGKTKYYVGEVWVTPIVIQRSRRNEIRVITSGSFICNSYLTRGVTSTIRNTATKTKGEITFI